MLNPKQSIENIRLPGQRRIFIDESASGNGNTIVLGSIIVDEDLMDYVTDEINKIRQDILSSMHALDYPIVSAVTTEEKIDSRVRSDHRRLMDGALPEIHAAELWNGAGIYCTPRSLKMSSFTRHIEWIERALSILPRTGIYFLQFQAVDVASNIGFLRKYETSWFDILSQRGKLPQYIKRTNVEKVTYEPYTRLLIEMLLTFDDLAERYDWKVEVACDEGKPNKIIRVLKAFDIIRERGVLGNFSIPKFRPSYDVPLLQLADVVTYIHHKRLSSPYGHPHRYLADRLYSSYIEPRIMLSRPKNYKNVMTDPRQYAIQTSIINELLVAHSPGVHSRHARERRLLARQRVEEIIGELNAGVLKPIIPDELLSQD